MSPWQTRMSLWRHKTGRDVREASADTAPQQWGSLLERAIADMYEQKMGVRGVRWPDTIRHPERPWMIAHLDWLGDERVCDFKTSRYGSGYGENGTDEVPPYVLLQLHHQMMLTGKRWADCAVLVSGSDLRIYHVQFRDSLANLLWDGEADFWGYVERDEPPPPETGEEVLQLYSRSQARAVAAPVEIEIAVKRLRELHAQMDEMGEEAKRLKDQVMVFMQDADTLVANGRELVTWKSDKRGRRTLNAVALNAAHPGLLDEFSVEGKPARRFLVKEV